MTRVVMIVTLLLVVACAAPDPATDPALHGTTPADDPNMPPSEGGYEVVSEDVNYYQDVYGVMAWPNVEGRYPGIVMIHEWWGLNQNIVSMARELASNGYMVLAVDLYNGEVASTPEDARRLVTSVDQAEAIANMKAAVEYMEERGSTRTGSLGWCFGGGQSLQLALAHDLDATVIYYGTLLTEQETLAAIEQPVLGIFAGEDASIPVTDVQAFNDSLAALGVTHEVILYPGVHHAFANPSGDRYAPDEAEDAWHRTLAFLEQNLR